MGVKAEEFGFGFPPRAIGFYKKSDGKIKFIFRKTPSDASGTIYSLNWVPLGGFVKIKGEDGSDKNDADSFGGKKIWQRAVILAAGVFMNVLLAMVIMSIGFGVGMPQVLEGKMAGAAVRGRAMQIVSVSSDSPAGLAGVKPGDEIISLGGRALEFRDMQIYLTDNVGKEVDYELKRGGETLRKKISPVILKETGKGGIGVGLMETGIVSYPWHLAIWRGISGTFYFLKEIVVAFASFFRNLIFGVPAAVDLSGPVGIAVMTGRVAKLGLIYILQFMAVLSLNLAVINILPFPALDGGRILFLGIEKLRGRPVSQKLENTIHNVGFAFLMVLIVAVTYGDFAKYGGRFVNLWNSIIR